MRRGCATWLSIDALLLDFVIVCADLFLEVLGAGQTFEICSCRQDRGGEDKIKCVAFIVASEALSNMFPLIQPKYLGREDWGRTQEHTLQNCKINQLFVTKTTVKTERCVKNR